MSEDFLPCAKRQTIEVIDRLGTKSEQEQCGHIESENLTKIVTPAHCLACILRVPDKKLVNHKAARPSIRDFQEPKLQPDGSLIYPRTGIEPPKVPEGYKRKSDDLRSSDAWVFLPLWKPCIDRVMSNSVSACGCVSINAFCGSKTCENKGKQINVNACANCPHARTLNLEPEKVTVDLSLGNGVAKSVVSPVNDHAEVPAKGS